MSKPGVSEKASVSENDRERDSGIAPGSANRFQLSTPVENLPGVGAQRASLLARLGIHRAVDLLFHFPREYQDPVDPVSADKLVAETRCCVVGEVVETEFRQFGPTRSLAAALLKIEGGFVRITWFNQPYRIQQFSRGTRWQVVGQVKRQASISWEMVHPEVKLLGVDEPPSVGVPQPIYPMTEGLPAYQLRKAIDVALEIISPKLEEVFPESFLVEMQLLPIVEALRCLHRPVNRQEIERARYRFVFQELFVLQLALAIRRAKRRSDVPAPQFVSNLKIHHRILRRFPFELTENQKQVIAEIERDMARPVPMNRMLQGDVGSGKTAVAQYTMLLAVAHGYQAAMMAPTETLARQHARNLEKSLAESKVRVELLSGSLTASQRQQVLDSAALGTVDIVVGTQSLISEAVRFHQLGVVVVDEQHRFGVAQRAALQGTGLQPHYLVMTATPIPRSMAMTMFGDLDISVLREKPPGRLPVHSYLGKMEEIDRWWSFVAKQLDAGRQAYVVTSRVEQEDDLEAAGAHEWYEKLRQSTFRNYRVGLIHGRMSGGEKDAILDRFSRHEIDLLVSTTVIEVGIDVPNATVMTVLDADRFGLAQLHQLRGRISRGSEQGFFCAFPRAGVAAEESQRLAALAQTEDGFEIAEIDFKLRGPGDLVGTRQHGMPPMRIANLVEDLPVLMEARGVAQRLIADDPTLEQPDWARMKKQVLSRYAQSLELADIG